MEQVEEIVVVKRGVGRPRKPIDPNFVKRSRGKPVNSKNKNGYNKQYTWEVTQDGETLEFENIYKIADHLNFSVQKVNKIIYNLLKKKHYDIIIKKKFNQESLQCSE